MSNFWFKVVRDKFVQVEADSHEEATRLLLRLYPTATIIDEAPPSDSLYGTHKPARIISEIRE